MKDDDIFKIVSDFMKGKSGSPDIAIAKLSFEGEWSPEELSRPVMSVSSTYDDFAKEYPVVVSGLSKCSLEFCLAVFGSMLTLPVFQSNAYRLEVLVNLAFLCAKGKARPTAAQVAAWFNQLDHGMCGRQECELDGSDVFGFRLPGLAVLAQFVTDLLAVPKLSGALDGGDVHEHVCPAIVGRDEAKTLVLVEKLNGTGCHEHPRLLSACEPSAELTHRCARLQPYFSATEPGLRRFVAPPGV